LVDILPPEADSSITMLGVDEKPNVKYEDVGGLDSQKQEIREAVELPLTQVSRRIRNELSGSGEQSHLEEDSS
jgi:ATP-dependent 26S proteasome regulatory subunit